MHFIPWCHVFREAPVSPSEPWARAFLNPVELRAQGKAFPDLPLFLLQRNGRGSGHAPQLLQELVMCAHVRILNYILDLDFECGTLNLTWRMFCYVFISAPSS